MRRHFFYYACPALAHIARAAVCDAVLHFVRTVPHA
jgi:hypothetical protein